MSGISISLLITEKVVKQVAGPARPYFEYHIHYDSFNFDSFVNFTVYGDCLAEALTLLNLLTKVRCTRDS
jgi:hypothetical protein